MIMFPGPRIEGPVPGPRPRRRCARVHPTGSWCHGWVVAGPRCRRLPRRRRWRRRPRHHRLRHRRPLHWRRRRSTRRSRPCANAASCSPPTGRTCRLGGAPSQRFGNAVDPTHSATGRAWSTSPSSKHSRGSSNCPAGSPAATRTVVLPDRHDQPPARRVVPRPSSGAARADGMCWSTSTASTRRSISPCCGSPRSPTTSSSAACRWPSAGRHTALRSPVGGDEANAQASASGPGRHPPRLATASPSGPRRRGQVHCIAHRLGNRVTLGPRGSIDGCPPGRKPFGQVILAAPDVAVGELTRRVPAAQARCGPGFARLLPEDRALWPPRCATRASRGPAGRGAGPGPRQHRRPQGEHLVPGPRLLGRRQATADRFPDAINLGWPPDQRVFTLDAIAGPPRFWQLR